MAKRDQALSIAAIVISIAAALGTWFGAIISVRSLNTHLEELRKADEVTTKSDWAQVIVFDIIDRDSWGTGKPIGVSFDQIREAYINEAKAAKGIVIDIDDLQPIELKKIIFSLISSAKVYRTSDGMYYTNRTVLDPSFPASVNLARTKYLILDALTSEGGKRTVSELYAELAKETKELTPDTYNLQINELIASKAVLVDEHNKLWAAANPPPSSNINSSDSSKSNK